MRWVRTIIGCLSMMGGAFLAYRAAAFSLTHDYVLTVCATVACVAAMRAGVLLLAPEVAE